VQGTPVLTGSLPPGRAYIGAGAECAPVAMHVHAWWWW
jgi:hypothetical protein